jgi:hypothetical protein
MPSLKQNIETKFENLKLEKFEAKLNEKANKKAN